MNPVKLAQSFLMDIAAGTVTGDEMRSRARLLAMELEPVAWPDGPTMTFAEGGQISLPGAAESRTLLDALLEDAAEHEAAGRLIQAANARAAVENLRQLPPWNKDITVATTNLLARLAEFADTDLDAWDCPHCDSPPSFNPNDVAWHYCGACHHFCDDLS
jgi:hypothetical protein